MPNVVAQNDRASLSSTTPSATARVLPPPVPLADFDGLDAALPLVVVVVVVSVTVDVVDV